MKVKSVRDTDVGETDRNILIRIKYHASLLWRIDVTTLVTVTSAATEVREMEK